ncbi:MAG TPA: HU family DNA-binding protein, partial [Ramlibacter sp.]|nr:HU family DNA-binding protein [Ramlibacter sp.]
SFKASARAERTGRNPRTGEALTIAASKSVKFVPGAALKASVNAS